MENTQVLSDLQPLSPEQKHQKSSGYGILSEQLCGLLAYSGLSDRDGRSCHCFVWVFFMINTNLAFA